MIHHTLKPDSLEITVQIKSLDASNAALLKQRFKELHDGKNIPVRVNLSGVDFIDSSGIGALLSLFKACNQQLVLVQPKPAVISVLELLRLHRVFEIETA